MDQLGAQADHFSGPSSAALDPVASLQLFPLRLARHDLKLRKTGERGDDIPGQPIGEVVRRRIATDVFERQEDDGLW